MSRSKGRVTGSVCERNRAGLVWSITMIAHKSMRNFFIKGWFVIRASCDVSANSPEHKELFGLKICCVSSKRQPIINERVLILLTLAESECVDWGFPWASLSQLHITVTCYLLVRLYICFRRYSGPPSAGGVSRLCVVSLWHLTFLNSPFCHSPSLLILSPLLTDRLLRGGSFYGILSTFHTRLDTECACVCLRGICSLLLSVLACSNQLIWRWTLNNVWTLGPPASPCADLSLCGFGKCLWHVMSMVSKLAARSKFLYLVSLPLAGLAVVHPLVCPIRVMLLAFSICW